MTVLLLSGPGPSPRYWSDLDGSLFDDRVDWPADQVRLEQLHYVDATGERRPLMRRTRQKFLMLVTYVLESILQGNDIDYESFSLRHVWDLDEEPATNSPEAVLLSTSFICNEPTLARAVGWVRDRYPTAPLVVGGQYTNIKFAEVLAAHPEIDFIMRGDGEDAIPRLVRALRSSLDVDRVPNLVYTCEGRLRSTRPGMIDLETYPAPGFPGAQHVVPYESMRGCPFNCRFCSYPAASPQWRYKSAEKILADWSGYVEHNGVEHIQALDSTFTVPRPRLKELLPRLGPMPLTWEAYTRANALHSAEVVDQLEASHCSKLSIGFESMSPNTLSYMHKQVRAPQNRNAHELLKERSIQYRISFMAGYPGETPDDYRLTHDFIVDDFTGYFMLFTFSFTDETMPVWQDADRFELQIFDREDPDHGWSHIGMDTETANALRQRTITAARWQSETAVWNLWQAQYETPLIPGVPRLEALRVEKLVERLAMLPVDETDQHRRTARRTAVLDELRTRFAVVPLAHPRRH